MIRITAQHNGFRRCGVSHSRTPTEYPDKAFTPDQIETMKAEPMLLVEVISDDPKKSRPVKDTEAE